MSGTTIFQDISIGTTLLFALPGAVSVIKEEIPVISDDAKAIYEDILVPAEAIIADVKLFATAGKADVVATDAAKTLADLSAFLAAAEKVFPLAEQDAASEYAKIAPVLSPIVSTIGIHLPAAILTQQTSAAANSATGTASAAS